MRLVRCERRSSLLVAAGVVAKLLSLAIEPASAQDYPDRPVRIIVPSAPAGGFDFVGRLVAQELGQRLGRSFIIENVSGAGTLIGTRNAARAEPDGYTLLVGGLSNFVLNMGLYKRTGYDPLKDFVALGMLYSVPYVLAARADLPQTSMTEIVAFARANPDSLKLASTGAGSGQDTIATVFIYLAQAKVIKVPYRGSTFVYPDLITGRMDLFFDTLQSVLPQAESGKVRIIATTGGRRSPAIPAVPTSAESGLPALTLERDSWFGLFAPAKTPSAIVERLRAAVAEIVRSGVLRPKFQTGGGEQIEMPVAEVEGFIRQETRIWVELIRNTGLSLE